MAKVSRVLRSISHGYVFMCPGCNESHVVNTANPNGRPNWGFNGNVDAPTFTPSILVRSGHYTMESAASQKGKCWCTYYEEHPDEERTFECFQCHSFVIDGRIQFLSDSTHKLSGQTVDLPDWRL